VIAFFEKLYGTPSQEEGGIFDNLWIQSTAQVK